jgi:hypothetical protein
MDVTSSFTYIDLSLENLEKGNFIVTHGDETGTLALSTDFDPVLYTDQILSVVRRDPTDRVWDVQDQEGNIRLLSRDSILTDFPFPPVLIPSTDAKTASCQALPASCPPPPKRRRGRRKARLSEAEKEERHRRFLERNRLAASKCRAKKNSEIEHLQEKKEALERENPRLKKVLRDLWDEVRLYREAIMAYTSCNHLDIVELVARNGKFATAIDALCQSLLGEGEGEREDGGYLDGGGSPRSPQISTFSEDRWLGCLSMSPLTSSPPSLESSRKGSII